jgi:hypothetical protein
MEITEKGGAAEDRSRPARPHSADEPGEPTVGASRIHGELLMLGFNVAQSTVSKYMQRGGRPPSQSWKTFLRNHAEAIAAIDLCIVRTLAFDLLFVFVVLGHGRRQLLWVEVTKHPTAEWLARQISEAFPWASAPAYLIRERLRTSFHRPGQSDGHPRPADHPSFTLAEWHCRTPDRHLASRVLGSTGDLWRGAPTTDPFRLCDLLQSDSPAFGFTQRRAVETSRPTVW